MSDPQPIAVAKLNGVYLHCATCVRQHVPQTIEALTNGNEIQLWCRHHNMNIGVFPLSVPLPTTCQHDDHRPAS